MKGPLGPCVSILKTLWKCYIATIRALVRLLFLFVFLQYLFARKGELIDTFALGFRKGDNPGTVEGLAPDASREEFVGASTDVFL